MLVSKSVYIKETLIVGHKEFFFTSVFALIFWLGV